MKNVFKNPFQCCSTAGCVTFMFIAVIAQNAKNQDTASLIAFSVSITVGLTVYFVTKSSFREENEKLEKNIENSAVQFVSSVSNAGNLDNEECRQLIKTLCSATYLGGHKKYGEKSNVNVVLTNDRLLLKEFPGNNEFRIDIPYTDITDFGLVTKDQLADRLTPGRLFLFGIFSLALSTNQQYIYIKYKDKMGFENNPLLGEFSGVSISEVSSKLYSLIELTRGDTCYEKSHS